MRKKSRCIVDIVIDPQPLLQEKNAQAVSGRVPLLHTALKPFSVGWPVQPESCWDGASIETLGSLGKALAGARMPKEVRFWGHNRAGRRTPEPVTRISQFSLPSGSEARPRSSTYRSPLLHPEL